MTSPIAPAQLLTQRMLAELSPAERAVLPFMTDLWLRPEQRIPQHDWRYCGFIAGRGWGKSFCIACEINRRVMLGQARHVALMAPNEDRVEEVQVKFLIDTAPLWWKPERYNGGVRWPNGVQAIAFTPEAPGRPRSENIELSWLCELVDWQPSTRLEAFNNITTATRLGRSQVLWDTTSKGRNEIIRLMRQLNREDPKAYPIIRGSMFDNPMLSRKYLRAECRKYSGRQYEEEVLGLDFDEEAGALWQQSWIDSSRTQIAPTSPELVLVALDPALSAIQEADETGIMVGARDRARHAHLLEDLSGKHTPEAWGDIAVQQCADHGAAGCVVERNHLGDNATFVLKSRASNRGITVRTLDRWTSEGCKPFPRRTPGVIYVREVVAASSKTSRAGGPAAETESGRVHVRGTMPELEDQLTTYVPGSARSPNRYDAAVYLITELCELWQERSPVKAESRAAANAHAELVRRMQRQGSRRIGI